jgi:glycosyltransferase involved in cell wall biosynthesis
MRKSRPDIVHTWMYHADMFGGLAARLVGNRNVIWGIRVDELTSGDARATVLVRRICAWLSRWVPRTIVCVAAAAWRSHVRVGYDATRMIVVPNGVDLSSMTASAEQRDSLRQACGSGPEELVIGTVGRFNTGKDQHNFIRAAGLLARRREGLRFLMVGRGLDKDNDELMRWIEQTGCAERFTLLGERADVPVCLAAMDIFCLSSRAEGFPNAAAEAMAMGLPCVVTDAGDAALLVADTGVVVPKEDSSALAEGLDSLLAMAPEARRSMGQRARARIQAEFTVERNRERFESIYQRLMEGSRS